MDKFSDPRPATTVEDYIRTLHRLGPLDHADMNRGLLPSLLCSASIAQTRPHILQNFPIQP